MSASRVPVLVAGAWLVAGVGFSSDAPVKSAPVTADDVIAGYHQAIGGIEKIRSVETIRMVGKRIEHRENIRGPNGVSDETVEVPFEYLFKRPDRARVEFSYQDKTGIQAYDGEWAWMVWPFTPSDALPAETAAMPMEDEAAQSFIEANGFLGHLVEPDRKGYEVELVGTEEREGREVYKLRVKLPSETVVRYDVGADDFLPVAQYATTADGEFTTVYEDYRPVEGLLLPHVTSVGVKLLNDLSQDIRIVYDEIDLNVDVADSKFKLP